MRRLALGLCLALPQLVFAQMVVVVSTQSAVEALDEQQVENIFLARTRRLPDGSLAMPIELEDDSLRQSFYEKIANKSAAQLDSYWATLIFTGKGRPPRRYDSHATLVETLNSGPGFVTYLPASDVPTGMKVVYRVPWESAE